MRKILLVITGVLCLGLFTACGESVSPIAETSLVEEVNVEETKPAIEKKDEFLSEGVVNKIDETEQEVVTEEDVETDEEAVAEETIEEEGESADENFIRLEFKSAMDEYEKFYDDYCAFMKKYTSSTDPMDTVNMLGDYTKMLQQMDEMDKKFEEWDSKDMTTAETAYYIDVTARIQKKLLEVSQ